MTTPTPDHKLLVQQGYDRVADKYLAWSAPRPTTTRLKYVQKLLGFLGMGAGGEKGEGEGEGEILGSTTASTTVSPPTSVPASVLELGCGNGVPCTQYLISHGLNVTGVDISAAQIALAREHVLPLTLPSPTLASSSPPPSPSHPQAPPHAPGTLTLLHADMTTLSYPPGTFTATLAFYSLFHLPSLDQGPMIQKIVQWLKPGGWLLLNLHVDEGEFVREDWFEKGVTMFSAGRGVEGNRRMMAEEGKGLVVVEEEVAVERVGRAEERFHWVLARKEEGGGGEGWGRERVIRRNILLRGEGRGGGAGSSEAKDKGRERESGGGGGGWNGWRE